MDERSIFFEFQVLCRVHISPDNRRIKNFAKKTLNFGEGKLALKAVRDFGLEKPQKSMKSDEKLGKNASLGGFGYPSELLLLSRP